MFGFFMGMGNSKWEKNNFHDVYIYLLVRLGTKL